MAASDSETLVEGAAVCHLGKQASTPDVEPYKWSDTASGRRASENLEQGAAFFAGREHPQSSFVDTGERLPARVAHQSPGS